MSGEPRDLGLQDLPKLSGARGRQGPEASTSGMGISCQARSRSGQSAPPPPPRASASWWGGVWGRRGCKMKPCVHRHQSIGGRFGAGGREGEAGISMVSEPPSPQVTQGLRATKSP